MEHHTLWLVAYGAEDRPVDPGTLKALFDLMNVHCDLKSEPVYAGTLNDRDRRERKRFRQWFDKAVDAQMETDMLAIGSVDSWIFDSNHCVGQARWDRSDARRRDPRVVLGVDLRLVNTRSAFTLCKQACEILVRDENIWYAYIDPTHREAVSDDEFYSYHTTNLANWDRLVEMRWWNNHGITEHKRVRGVFWANVLGAEFCRRLMETGFQDRCRDENVEPIVLEHQGRVAILMDRFPEIFAYRRAAKSCMTDRCVVIGSILRECLASARLL